MSIIIKDISYKKKPLNEMEDLKYLICAIDSCKYPSIPSPPSNSIILPPRVEESLCLPPRRPPCVPPPRCYPIIPGPCCPQLPLPIYFPYCNSCSPLPYYSSK